MKKERLNSKLDYTINVQFSEVEMPETDLIAAVIGRAAKDLNDKNVHYRDSASRWFESEDTTPMSFNWCCEALSLDKESTLNLVKKKEEDRA